MKRIPVFLSFCIALFSFTSVFSRSLDETAAMILNESPAYKINQKSLATSEAELMPGANLPDPELAGEFLAAPPDESNRWAAELSWSLEWPGVYNARKEQIALQKNALSAALDATAFEQLTEIKSLLLQYILQQQKIDIIDRLALANDSIYQFAQNARKGGELTVLDINKIKLENANLRASRAALTDELGSTISGLSEIYGGDCYELLTQMDCHFPDIVFPEEDNIDRLAAESSAVKAAQKESEAIRAGDKIARMENLPGISFGYKHAYEDGIHFNGATLGITLPIFSGKHKRQAIKIAAEEADYKAEAAARSARTELAVGFKRLKIMKEQIAEVEPLIFSSDNHATLLKAYESGLITLLDYLTERNYFTTATIQFIELKYAAAQVALDLQKYYRQ